MNSTTTTKRRRWSSERGARNVGQGFKGWTHLIAGPAANNSMNEDVSHSDNIFPLITKHKLLSHTNFFNQTAVVPRRRKSRSGNTPTPMPNKRENTLSNSPSRRAHVVVK